MNNFRFFDQVCLEGKFSFPFACWKIHPILFYQTVKSKSKKELRHFSYFSLMPSCLELSYFRFYSCFSVPVSWFCLDIYRDIFCSKIFRIILSTLTKSFAFMSQHCRKYISREILYKGKDQIAWKQLLRPEGRRLTNRG